MKKYLGIFMLVLIVSCKSAAVLNQPNPRGVLDADKIIANNFKSKKGFSTISIRATAKYRDEKESQNVSAEIKIKKDEKILVIIRFLGITMAKGLITPNEVKYYEKINGTYFEGDYQTLSKWLGTDLDFQKVQNLLIGEAIDDLSKGKFTSSLIDNVYKLSATDGNTEKSFFFEPEQFLITKQEIIQAKQNRNFEVVYSNFQEFSKVLMPSTLEIQAIQDKGKTNISINYSSVIFNEEVTFPYSVPEGYERKYIN